MTRRLFSILTMGILFSCTSKDNHQNSNAGTSVDFKTLDTIIPFSGYWLSEDYFNSIREFKSPKKAQEGSEFIIVPDRTLKLTMIIFNFHEGGPQLTILKNHSTYQIWEFQEDSITVRMNDIERISPTKIKIGDKNFIKINPLTAKDNSLVLEEILFKGHYTTLDGHSVEFKNNGQLNGLDSFRYYSPIIDYLDTGMQVDQVGLGKSEKDLNRFGFKFNGDILELYKLNCITYDSTNKKCAEVDFGELAYRLWRNE